MDQPDSTLPAPTLGTTEPRPGESAQLPIAPTTRYGRLRAKLAAFAAALKRLGPAAYLGFAWAASPAILGSILFVYLPTVAEYLDSLGPWAWPLYVAFFILSAGVGFLPTYGQSFLGGWAFGFAGGFPGAMLGFVGGSVIGYFISQRVSRERVEAELSRTPRAKQIRDALVGRGFLRTTLIVSLIRVPPNAPFAVTNLVLASSGIGLGPYIIGTALGMAPRTALAVFFAAQAHTEGAKNILDILQNRPWWEVFVAIGIFVVVLATIGAIANRAVSHVTSPMRTEPDESRKAA